MNRIQILRSKIIKAKQAYYFGSTPIMADAEYDAMEEELALIDKNDPVVKMVGCPIPIKGILSSSKHSIFMTSQDKVKTSDEFKQWYEKRAKGLPVHVSYKGDGSSVAAYYKDGYLVKAISRGDGSVGEDITANVVMFKGLPAYFEHNDIPFSGSIRFEAVLTKPDWQIVGGKNPRNQVSGIAGRKDGLQSKYVTAYAFDVVSDDIDFATESEKSSFLLDNGINVMPSCICNTVDEVIEKYDEIMKLRGASNDGDIDFWIDGIVIKIDSLMVQEELGFAPSGKYHKGQVAWKPEAEGAETVLLSCILTGGHTGEIIPNARFEPIEIGGTTINKALLNNWEEIVRLDIAIGDTIFVVKANDIIPKIIKVVKRPANRQVIPEPTNCPFCDGATKRNMTLNGNGSMTMCINADCPAKQDLKLKTWLKKTNILGVGDSARQALQEQLNIFTAADIYKLGREITVEEIREIVLNGNHKFGINADTLIEEIDKKRNLPLYIFLGSLGIDGLGRREVQIACEKKPDDLSTLADWRSGKLYDKDLAVEINAPNKAAKWAKGIEVMADIIDNLLKNGVTVQDFKVEPKNTAETICITGVLPSGKKKNDYKSSLTEAGLLLVSKVDAELSFLVVADATNVTGKLKKVMGYNKKGAEIKIITEEELVAML